MTVPPIKDDQQQSMLKPVEVRAHLLTRKELENYRRDGFVVPQFRLPQSELSNLRKLVLQLVKDNPALADHLMNSPHVPGVKGQNLKTQPGWMQFAAHPAILDIVEQILGPDIILRGSAVFYKRPGVGPATAWHQDAYQAPIFPPRTTSVWIAVSDSFVDNACLRFIPGSHSKQVVYSHRHEGRTDLAVDLILDEGEYDENQAVDVELEAGQMVLFDFFAIHGSRANLGTRERASLALRFMPATSRYDHGAVSRELRDLGHGHEYKPLILVRGANRAENDLNIGHAK